MRKKSRDFLHSKFQKFFSVEVLLIADFVIASIIVISNRFLLADVHYDSPSVFFFLMLLHYITRDYEKHLLIVM